MEATIVHWGYIGKLLDSAKHNKATARQPKPSHFKCYFLHDQKILYNAKCMGYWRPTGSYIGVE